MKTQTPERQDVLSSKRERPHASLLLVALSLLLSFGCVVATWTDSIDLKSGAYTLRRFQGPWFPSPGYVHGHSEGGWVLGDFWLVDPGTTEVDRLPNQIVSISWGRVGHTGSVSPDGRVRGWTTTYSLPSTTVWESKGYATSSQGQRKYRVYVEKNNSVPWRKCPCILLRQRGESETVECRVSRTPKGSMVELRMSSLVASGFPGRKSDSILASFIQTRDVIHFKPGSYIARRYAVQYLKKRTNADTVDWGNYDTAYVLGSGPGLESLPDQIDILIPAQLLYLRRYEEDTIIVEPTMFRDTMTHWTYEATPDSGCQPTRIYSTTISTLDTAESDSGQRVYLLLQDINRMSEEDHTIKISTSGGRHVFEFIE